MTLPDDVLALVAELPPEQRLEFFATLDRRSVKLLPVYASSTVYAHYLLLGRWSMTAWMWSSLFVAAAVGLLWWATDLVRIPNMVREHNQQLAEEIALSLASEVPAQAGA